MDWTQLLAGFGVVTAIVAAGFAMGRNEWNKTTMQRYHDANDELRNDNDDLRDQLKDLRVAVKAEHEDCERRLTEEVQKWAQKVGHLEGQIETFQTETVTQFVGALQEGVLTVVANGVAEGVETGLRKGTGNHRRADG